MDGRSNNRLRTSRPLAGTGAILDTVFLRAAARLANCTASAGEYCTVRAIPVRRLCLVVIAAGTPAVRQPTAATAQRRRVRTYTPGSGLELRAGCLAGPMRKVEEHILQRARRVAPGRSRLTAPAAHGEAVRTVRLPGRMCRVAGVAMPGRVRVGNGGAPQRVPLRQPAGLAVAAFGLLDLGDQQPQPTLVEASFDCSACLLIAPRRFWPRAPSAPAESRSRHAPDWPG